MPLTDGQLESFRKLLADSKSTHREVLRPPKLDAGDYHDYRYLRGFNGGIEHAEMLLKKILEDSSETIKEETNP